MARKKQIPNPKSKANLKRICDELKITQKQLSEVSGVSENTISKIATGKGPLTREIAEEIVKACPSYRIEWLLGIDDDPYNVIKIKIPGLEAARKRLDAAIFLHGLGYEIGQINDKGIFFPVNEIGGFCLSEHHEAEIKKADSVIWRGSLQEIESVLLEICDFSLFKIERLAKGYV